MQGVNLVLFGMFAKYWESGKVKTRLAATLGADMARDVYLVFLEHLVQRFSASGDRRCLAFSPTERGKEFDQLVGESWDIKPQANGDLGHRMSVFFEEGLATAQKVILIGSDTPHLPIEFVDQAVSVLDSNDLVVGPSPDGGYYLIGMSRFCRSVFDEIAWSTPSVLLETKKRIKAASISCGWLPSLRDVDELDDLEQMLNRLQASESNSDKVLLRKLRSLGLSLGESEVL
ncbi:MAG: TIGR04282 family arsenosugar biosynthesis glycosyltransferase [Planctomycetota bacterium]